MRPRRGGPVSTGHAPVPPSFLDTVVHCHGSLALARANPQPDTDATREGNVAHKVAMLYALASTRDGIAPESKCCVLPKLGDIIDGIRVDAEMVGGAKLYAEALEGFAGNPEQTIPIHRIHPGLIDPETGEITEICFGTPDFWQYRHETKTLRITDYKYGHLYVEVYENYQLIAYAAGALELLAKTGVLEADIIVEFLIVQPRCYSADSPVREWVTSASNLRTYINEAAQAVADALAPNPKTKAGTHCLFCPARGICKTAHKASTAILEYAGTVEAMSQNPHEIGLRLNLINAAITILKGVGTGLEEQAMQMIRRGAVVPWFKIGHSTPREVWTKPAATVATLSVLAGKKIALTEQAYAMTPKQAIKAGIPEALVRMFSTQPHGKARLEAESDASLARVFKR